MPAQFLFQRVYSLSHEFSFKVDERRSRKGAALDTAVPRTPDFARVASDNLACDRSRLTASRGCVGMDKARNFDDSCLRIDSRATTAYRRIFHVFKKNINVANSALAELVP